MSDINPEEINLNLIPVLRALLRERSVSGAAASLGRSPSAVSETLAQLRTLLEDPLLVRVGGHLQPTAKAADLLDPLEDLHKRLQGLFRKRHFEPATSTRNFTIASSDLMVYELGSAMVQAIRQRANKMSVHFVDVGRGLTEKMAAREIDFVLLPEFAVEDLAPAPIKFKALKETRLMALINHDHPLARRRSIGPEDLRPYRHVAFAPDAVLLEGRRKAPQRAEFYAGSRQFDMAVTVSQVLTIPLLLKGTDLVAVIPGDIATAVSRDGSLVAVHLEHHAAFKLGLAWSPVYDSDDAHRWFRNTITEKSYQSASADMIKAGLLVIT